MPRYYFNADEIDAGHDETLCYSLAHHIDLLAMDQKSEVRLYPAQRIVGTGDFWCSEFDFWGEKGDAYKPCGKACDAYEPRNGKSGSCRHSGHLYDSDHTKPIILKADGTIQLHHS